MDPLTIGLSLVLLMMTGIAYYYSERCHRLEKELAHLMETGEVTYVPDNSGE